MRISVIVPVYNRPDEVDELLGSLASAAGASLRAACGEAIQQSDAPFDMEVIIVEDGSTVPCREVVEGYADKLKNLKYFLKTNSGPGLSRNYGAERATGDYFVFLDSDCVVPTGWLAAIEKAIEDEEPLDAWGGADRAASSFTPLQKAINYAMTSPLTTGGIRGGGQQKNGGGESARKSPKSLDKFHPRSFNMGLRREVFERVGGFGTMRFGEDIDLSYRTLEAGFTTRLLPEAWVWHKRRTRWRQFFKQVFNSGSARVALSRLHRGTLKPVHLLPALFTIGVIYSVAVSILGAALSASLCISFWEGSPDIFGVVLTVYSTIGGLFLPFIISPFTGCLYALWAVVIFFDALIRTNNIKVARMAVWASLIQLTAYGLGFLRALFTRRTAFTKSFYR